MSPSENSEHQVRKAWQSDLQTIKLRSSCDLCTEAKVRCDKQHPQCGRCIRLGNTCHYSVSMRTAKPAIDFVKSLNTGMLLTPPNRPAQTTYCEGELTVAELLHRVDCNQTHRANHQGGQGRSSRSTTKPPTPPAFDSVPSPPFQGQDLSLELELGLPDSSSPFYAIPNAQTTKRGLQSGQNTCSPSHNQFESADDFTLPGTESQAPYFSTAVPPTLDFDYFSQFGISESELPWISVTTPPSTIGQGANDNTIPVDSAPQQPQAPLYGHCCGRTAKKLKQSVLLMESRGEMMKREHNIQANTPPIITTDQALLMCSNISKQIIQMLQCRCETDAYLPFLISVLISKVLGTYGAIAKIDDSTLFKFGSNAKMQKEQEQEHQQEAFVAVTLRLGAYDVDGELEVVLRARLVLYELSKLECMIQLFEEKYCQAGGDEKLGEDRTILSALAQFIKHRYTRTKAACELRSPLPPLEFRN